MRFFQFAEFPFLLFSQNSHTFFDKKLASPLYLLISHERECRFCCIYANFLPFQHQMLGKSIYHKWLIISLNQRFYVI